MYLSQLSFITRSKKYFHPGVSLLSVLVLTSWYAAAEPVSIAGRWSQEGKIGTYAFNRYLSDAASGNHYAAGETITIQYRVDSGGVVSASGGSLPVVCITKAGTTTVDPVCHGGVLVNLPPVGASFGYRINDSLGLGGYDVMNGQSVSVSPSGKSSVYSGQPSASSLSYSPASVSWPAPNPSRPADALPGGYQQVGSGTIYVSGNNEIAAWAGSGDFPEFNSHYTGSVTVKLGSFTEVWTYNITLIPPAAKCTVTPPSTVSFDTVPAQGRNDRVSLATAETTISASCFVYEGAEDISKGMYLTFEPGSYGIYGGDLKKLATSLTGIYITGGSDTAQAQCANSNISFNGIPAPDFRLGTLAAGISAWEKNLHFSLCHDLEQPLVSGDMVSDAKVNVVVQ